jgi:trk system potassium uptake protein TrkH
MNGLLDAYLLGWLLLLLGVLQGLPLAVAIGYGEPLEPFLLSASVAGVFGASVVGSTRARSGVERSRLRPRDGFVVVGVGWMLVSLFGALPYFLTDTLSGIDALFESVAGFTTTGSSVMTDLQGSSRALLLWRSLTQWVGGMGIVLFTIAILPLLPVGGMQLFRAEVPGPTADKLAPRVTETARRLWLIYVGFTVLEIAALWGIGRIPFFDAVCHGLTTLATGGFSTRDGSVGAFHSATVEWIVILFMIAAGINFALHYRLIVQRRFRRVWADGEFRYFVLVLAGVTVVVTLSVGSSSGTDTSLRTAMFQTVSILTSTGYSTTDFEVWPSLTQLVLLQLMFLGGMSGSTAGGVKSLRVLIGLRAMRVVFARLLHPRVVRTVQYAGRTVPEDVISSVWAFFTVYALLATVLAAVIAASGYDPLTAISAALTAVSNVGPGLGAIGPYDNFAHFPVHAKLALCFGMLAGRLEIFTLLVLVSRGFWRR